MNRLFYRIIALLLVCFLLGGTINIVSPYNATLTGISGDVCRKRHRESIWVTANNRDILSPGDELKTGYNSKAKLRFSNGSIVEVGAETKVSIYENYLFLAIGLIKSYITKFFPNFEVRTPTAIAGVRGTEFTVEVLPDQTTIVSVYEGIVDVTTEGKTVRLKKGETTIVRSSAHLQTPRSHPHSSQEDKSQNSYRKGRK
jgi:hypothetical protein